MSTETAKTIKRHWHIIWYLSSGQYVSTSNIREHLTSLNIDVELRTIQRDLSILKEHFPLDCRKDSMPHSWRWQKSPSPSNALNVTQAVTLRLVEEQLQDLLSPRLIQELQPLFAQAKAVTGMADVSQQIDHILSSSMPKPKGGNTHGIIGGGVGSVGGIIGGVRSWLEDVFTQDDKQDDFKQLDKAINELIEVMREQGLEELMDGFKS